jgi:hypothetical protein
LRRCRAVVKEVQRLNKSREERQRQQEEKELHMRLYHESPGYAQ